MSFLRFIGGIIKAVDEASKNAPSSQTLDPDEEYRNYDFCVDPTYIKNTLSIKFPVIQLYMHVSPKRRSRFISSGMLSHFQRIEYCIFTIENKLQLFYRNIEIPIQNMG
jgi:hypothetical protein